MFQAGELLINPQKLQVITRKLMEEIKTLKGIGRYGR